jgi:hypothetical protein
MSELIEHLTQQIARVRELPREQQPEAFEEIRRTLEAQISDATHIEEASE